jgi:anaerobic ribonucleoside-triphosphate reductase activating protein
LARGVEGLGPGRRTVVWVAGCDRNCPGCIAPELLPPREPDLSVADASALLLADAGWDGRLTISGGEPFRQAGALAALIERLRAERDCEVLAYSGFLRSEIETGNREARALLSQLDMLIDGPFLVEASCTLPWRGSDNQRFHALTARARRYEAAAAAPAAGLGPLSVQPLSDSQMRIVGIPARDFVRQLERRLAERGIIAAAVRRSPRAKGRGGRGAGVG